MFDIPFLVFIAFEKDEFNAPSQGNIPIASIGYFVEQCSYLVLSSLQLV